MSTNIFTYGSLMFPEVWTRVVRGGYRCARAQVSNHARFAITGETYPGMVPAPGEAVQGVVYFDLMSRDVAALDAFEGSDYRRDTLSAMLDSGEIITVETYIYLRPAHLENAPWHPEDFQMERFMNTYCRARLAE